ncbi:MAG: BrnT family toxin [Gemmatimonadales bacterium]
MLDLAVLLADVEGFEWDAGNTAKNVLGHRVSQTEAEEVFFLAPIVLLEDEKHSAEERRYLIFGPTGTGRLLTAAFTLRQRRLRLISVRDMSHQERRRYAQAR